MEGSPSGLPRRWHGLPAAPHVASCLAVALAAWGCDVRDEPVRSAGGAGLWPARRPAAASGLEPAAGPSGIEYVQGYAAAAAAASGRPLLLVFGASWCRWTGELARGPLADRDVIARSRGFVCAFVDADRDAATCRAFGVEAFPTVLVIDADGRERHRSTGTTGAGDLASALDAVAPRGERTRRLADERRGPGGSDDVTR